MTFIKEVVVVSVVCVVAVCGQWVNNYDGDALLECKGNNLMNFIGSEHSNHHEDRRWQYRCRNSPAKVHNCKWTGFLNGFDHNLMFLCPGNEVLNGMFSINSNHHEDRRFSLLCCSVDKKSTKNCHFSDFINDWDGIMHYNIPDGKVMKGVYSVHNNKKEDRRWKINTCFLA